MTDRRRVPVRGVVVGSFASRPLADLARSYLEDNGVDAVVDADDGNGTQPEVGFVTGGARVVVAPGEVAAASELLAAVAPGPLDEPAGRTHERWARWVAGTVAATMALLGVWTVVVLVLF